MEENAPMLGKRPFTICLMIAALLFVAVGSLSRVTAAEIDLSRAIVVVPDGLSGPENKAVRLLVEEVRKRSRIGWDVMIRWPSGAVPVIAVGPARLLDSFPRELREHVPLLRCRQAEGRLPHPDQTAAARRSPGRAGRRQ